MNANDTITQPFMSISTSTLELNIDNVCFNSTANNTKLLPAHLTIQSINLKGFMNRIVFDLSSNTVANTILCATMEDNSTLDINKITIFSGIDTPVNPSENLFYFLSKNGPSSGAKISISDLVFSGVMPGYKPSNPMSLFTFEQLGTISLKDLDIQAQ